MRTLLLFSVGVFAVAAQPISFGFRAGTPLNDAFVDAGGNVTLSHSTQRFILGPSVELHLPFHLGIEADALYRRYNIGGTVNHWEFPILAKYRFGIAPVLHPFVDAGPSFNYVSDPGHLLDRPHASTTGFAMGGGIEIKLLLVRIAPEIRYTRWTDKNINLSVLNSGLSSNQNQADFLIGITF